MLMLACIPNFEEDVGCLYNVMLFAFYEGEFQICTEVYRFRYALQYIYPFPFLKLRTSKLNLGIIFHFINPSIFT